MAAGAGAPMPDKSCAALTNGIIPGPFPTIGARGGAIGAAIAAAVASTAVPAVSIFKATASATATAGAGTPAISAWAWTASPDEPEVLVVAPSASWVSPSMAFSAF